MWGLRILLLVCFITCRCEYVNASLLHQWECYSWILLRYADRGNIQPSDSRHGPACLVMTWELENNQVQDGFL